MTVRDDCDRLIAWFYQMPVRDMGGGLTIVELPARYMESKDVDVIKRALKLLADGESAGKAKEPIND